MAEARVEKIVYIISIREEDCSTWNMILRQTRTSHIYIINLYIINPKKQSAAESAEIMK
jgi:hypothetical protein